MRSLLHFTFIISLLGLAACGAKKSSISLKVSSGFALSNNSYEGGLVFFGTSNSGKSFSIPISFSPSGINNSVELELDRDTWTFAAVGWENGPITAFEGIAKCAKTTATLNSAEQTVILTLDSANCNDSYFGGNTFSNNFKTLDVITCGTLNVDMAGTPFTYPTHNSTYCSSSPSLKADLKIHAKSMIVSALHQVSGSAEQTSSLSYCVDLINGKTSGHQKRFPSKNFPLKIDFYETSCATTESKPMAKFLLSKGLDFTYSGFDHKLFDTTGTTGLILLPTISRKSTSSLLNSMPEFRCDETDQCIAFPTLSVDRVIRPDEYFYLKEEGSNTCADLTGIVNVALSLITFNPSSQCKIENGKMFIKLSQANIGSACSSPCSLSAGALTPTPLSLVKEDATNNVQSLDAYDHIYRLTGHQDFLADPAAGSEISAFNSLRLFNGIENDESKTFGALSEEREFFRPDVAGLFGAVTSTSLIGKSVNIQVWDEGELRPFNLKAEADSTLMPNYIFIATDPTAVGSNRYFTHKITLSRIVGGAYYPMKVMRIDFGNKVGMSESYHQELDTANDRKTIHRSLVYWNTEVADYERYERYDFEKETLASDTSNIQQYRTAFMRAERDSVASEGNARLEELRFESKKNGSNYNESAHKRFTFLKNTKASHQQSHTQWTGSTVLSYFSQDEFADFNRQATPNMNTAYARSPNNQKQVWAWSEWTGSYWNLKVVIKSSGSAGLKFNFTVNSDAFFIPKVTINNGGEVGLGWVEFDTTAPIYTSFAMVYNGTAWVDSTGTTVANSSAPSTGLANHTSPLVIDILDNDPSSNISDKTVVYSTFSSLWYINAKQFASSTWGTVLTPGVSTNSFPPKQVKLNLVGDDYWISTVYDSSGNKIKMFKTDDFTSVDASSSAESIMTTKHMATYYDGSQMHVYLFDTDPNNHRRISFTSALGSSGASSFGSSMFDILRPQYCFSRSMSTSANLNASATTGCVVPDTSYAEPIRSDVYHQDIEGLKPTTFESIFTLN